MAHNSRTRNFPDIVFVQVFVQNQQYEFSFNTNCRKKFKDKILGKPLKRIIWAVLSPLYPYSSKNEYSQKIWLSVFRFYSYLPSCKKKQKKNRKKLTSGYREKLLTDRLTDRSAGRQTDRQAGKQTDRQADRQTDNSNFIGPSIYGGSNKKELVVIDLAVYPLRRSIIRVSQHLRKYFFQGKIKIVLNNSM